MKRFLPLMILILAPFFGGATIHIVEAGGSNTVTPYYLPQFFSINQGDTVVWDMILGTHNVTTTSAPVSIESDDIEAPGTFQWVFTVPGDYEYECSLWDHADTQFGTITVLPLTDVADLGFDNELTVYPNPASDLIHFQMDDETRVEDLKLFTINGTEVKTQISLVSKNIDVSNLASGHYILMMTTSEGTLRRRIAVRR